MEMPITLRIAYECEYIEMLQSSMIELYVADDYGEYLSSGRKWWDDRTHDWPALWHA